METVTTTTPLCPLSLAALVISVNTAAADHSHESGAALEQRVAALLGRMTLAEKVGQMNQLSAGNDVAAGPPRAEVRAGRVGAVLNVVDPGAANALQHVAVEESRMRIPLLFGRDNTRIVEPGEFHLRVGGSSDAGLRGAFRLVDAGAAGASP